jgi:glycosyltransferase involved in cell wall biosynthesis
MEGSVTPVTYYLVDDCSNDDTSEILSNSTLNKHVVIHKENMGLRYTILEFFTWARENDIDIIGILGNDCVIKRGAIDKIIDVLLTTDLDIVSPNYLPSNPAFSQGKEDVNGKGYREAINIVGLWFMDRRLTDDVLFDTEPLSGIRGSMSIQRIIQLEKNPKTGWIPEVLLIDVGHWSGKAQGHIKSKEHEEYSKEVGRSINWSNE